MESAGLGSAFASKSASVVIVPVIVAVTEPTGGAGATVGFTNTSFAVAFAGSSPVLLDFTDPWPLTPDLSVRAATAAIGVIRIAKLSKSAVNSLRLLGVDERERLFTVIYFLR